MTIDYKNFENPKDKEALFLFNDDEEVEKPNLKYINEEKTESISNQIQLITELWTSKDFNSMLDELRRFSESFRTIKDNYIPESITTMIEVIFDIFNSYFYEDKSSDLLADKYKQNVLIECLIILVNITSHTDLISYLPPTLFEFCCSQFLEHKMSSTIPEKNNIYILCPDCLKILVNLTSNENSCLEIANRISLDDIQQFYFNQVQILTYHLYQDLVIKQQKQCLKIFYNILINSNIEESDFPVDQVLIFLQKVIDSSRDTSQIKWINKIIFLIVQNESAAYKVMSNDYITNFVNTCLNNQILRTIFRKEDPIIETEITSLQIISMLLNIENYICGIDIEKVIELANNQNNFKLVLTALETLKNFADCPEHSDILIDSFVLPIIYERLTQGIHDMKQAASKILVNLFYYTPINNFSILLQYETDYEKIYLYKNLVDVLSETDDSDIIYFGLLGFLNFFTRIIELGIDFQEVFNFSGLLEILPDLGEQIEDQNINDAKDSLMAFIRSKIDI